MSSLLDADEIYALIPHSGPMRLLDRVVDWDERGISCSAAAPLSPAHPLRQDGYLANVHALEYAAQAIAVHNSLFNGRKPIGKVFIGAFRDVDMIAGPFDQAEAGSIDIRAEVEAAAPGGWSYRFNVGSGGTMIARGKILVVVPEE